MISNAQLESPEVFKAWFNDMAALLVTEFDFTPQDIHRYITAAILDGERKGAVGHLKQTFQEIADDWLKEVISK